MRALSLLHYEAPDSMNPSSYVTKVDPRISNVREDGARAN